MKHPIKVLSTAILAGTVFMGCQSVASTSGMTSPTNKTNTSNPVKHTLSDDALKGFEWQLVDAKDANGKKISALFTQPNKPLTLNFTKIIGLNVLYLKNTCNSFSAKYAIDNGDLTLGHFTSTMKACSTPEANFDNAAVKVVNGNYKIVQAFNSEPVLTITNNGQVARFKAVAK